MGVTEVYDCTEEPLTIAVVGGGASGVLTAAQLLRNPSSRERTVVLIDRRATIGAGTAFGTRRPCHLLNVRAASMSAFPDDPRHFVTWAQQCDPTIDDSTFVSRAVYGDYLREVLRDAARGAGPRARLALMTGEVESIDASAATDGGGGVVRMRGGTTIQADAIVLALGNVTAANPKIEDPSFYESSRYTPDPWAPGAIDAVPADEPVLLIGTGLTAVDVLLTLESRGHGNAIHAISRHGLIPQRHLEDLSPPSPEIRLDGVLAARTARRLVRALRVEVDAALERGEDWRTVIDSLRPHAQCIWRSLDDRERRRFMRHASRYWEVHRHRMAPAVGRTVDAVRACGHLGVTPGRLVGFSETADGVNVLVRERSGELAVLRVGHVVNCTGPRHDVVAAGEPVVDALVGAGLVRAGPLGLGVDVDERGAVRDANGHPSSVLWTLGALRRGALYESTAIPEIRAQAAELAGVLLSARTNHRGRLRSAVTAAV